MPWYYRLISERQSPCRRCFCCRILSVGVYCGSVALSFTCYMFALLARMCCTRASPSSSSSLMRSLRTAARDSCNASSSGDAWSDMVSPGDQCHQSQYVTGICVYVTRCLLHAGTSRNCDKWRGSCVGEVHFSGRM